MNEIKPSGLELSQNTTEPMNFRQFEWHLFEMFFFSNFSFPMELHMVFYKKQYRNVRSAMENSDGLTVLAFFFNVSDAVFQPL